MSPAKVASMVLKYSIEPSDVTFRMMVNTLSMELCHACIDL